MSNFRRTAIASVINLTLSGIPVAQAAYTEALEKRIRELESRLEKLDKAEALKAKPVASAGPEGSPEVEKLNRKINTLERKLEVQDEVTAGNFAKLPIFDTGADGFKITSADKKHQIRIRAATQTDVRTFVDDPSGKSINTFSVRQARIWLEGYLFKNIYYKIMPDFAATNILPDAYIDYAYHPSAELLAGKFKPAVSLERLQGDSDGTFMERAFPTYLAPNRDVGIQLHGGFAKPSYSAETVPGPIDTKNFFNYQLGVDNGSGDSGSVNGAGGATYDSKEFVGRAFVQPFQHTNPWIEGLGIGIAGTLANPSQQTLQNQVTPLGQTVYLNYANTVRSGNPNTGAVNAPVLADGTKSRIYPQAYWYGGPFGIIGEYVTSSQQITGKNNAGRTINVQQNNRAWQVLASYVLTGEDNTFGSIKPIQNFSPLDGKWGALQLVGRWTEMAIDKNTFQLIDPTQAPNHATAWTVGLNWYLNSFALVRADYEQVNFNGGAGTVTGTNATNARYHVGDRPTEHVFGTRFQLSF